MTPVAASTIPTTGNPFLDVLLGVVAAVAVAFAGAQMGKRQTLAEIRRADAESELAEARTGTEVANAAKTITDIAMDLLEPLEVRAREQEQQLRSYAERQARLTAELEQATEVAKRCHQRVDDLELELAAFKAHVAELERRLLAAGEEVPPRPELIIPEEGDTTP